MITIKTTDNGVEYVDARAPHALYGYESHDGTRFGVWDARPDGGRIPTTIKGPDGKPAALGAMTMESRPEHWRKLHPGIDRVFVAMTPAMARHWAITTADEIEANPKQARKLRRSFASRDDAERAFAAEILQTDLPDCVMVTGGMIDALARDAPDPEAMPDTAPAPEMDLIPVFVPDVTLTFALEFRDRAGASLTDTEWRAKLKDRAYRTIGHDIVPQPYDPTVPVAYELCTIWAGVMVDGNPDTLYRSGLRLRHLCGDPNCTTGGYTTVLHYPTEAEAIEGHRKLVEHCREGGASRASWEQQIAAARDVPHFGFGAQARRPRGAA